MTADELSEMVGSAAFLVLFFALIVAALVVLG